MKHHKLDKWGSVLTPYHASNTLGMYLVNDIKEALGYSPVGMQMGNVIGQLRNLREFDLISEIEESLIWQ